MVSLIIDEMEVKSMNDQYLENEGLELLDALEIGFDLTHYDLEEEHSADRLLADNT